MLKNYCHISNQRPPNCLNAKFGVKIRIKFGIKNVFFGCFGKQFWKTIVIIKISALKFAVLQNLEQKRKILKIGTKNARFPYFGTGTSKYYCHMWKFSSCCKVWWKIKILKFGSKNAGFGYFWTGSWKLNCHIWNQHPRICLILKLCEKTKMPKFGTRNALFGYFWPNMPSLGYFWARILKKLLSYLQSAPSNLSNLSIYKTLQKKKKKKPKFGTKNALFGYFWPKMRYLGTFVLQF